jgi:hypothetical protein
VSGITVGFRDWLRRQRDRPDPVGDLAREAHHDHGWPRGRARLDTLHLHLDDLDACDGAHDALDCAWIEWIEEARTP